METVRFTVPGAPKGKARARTVHGKGGGTFSYTPEQTVLYENLIKCCYRDDTQVVTLHMEKHYAEDPRVEVEIEEIK